VSEQPIAVTAEPVDSTEATVLAWAVDYAGTGNVFLIALGRDVDPRIFDPRLTKGCENALAALVKITIPLDALRRLR
jgi:hypothetical protein